MHTHDTHPGRFAGRQVLNDPRAAREMAGDCPRGHGGWNDGPVRSPDDGDDSARGPRRHDHGGRPGGFGPMGFGPTGFGPGAFGPGGPRRRGRRFGRGGRGDVRAAILLLLVEGPMHGYQLIQQITERSGGTWTPSPGSVYPALSQLEDEGLVHLERVEGRNTASLTEAGVTHVAEHKSDLGTPWEDASEAVSSEVRDLRDEVSALMTAAQQVSHVGTAAQVAEASRLLIQARKALYRILADDEA
ncbi:MAG: PadR family transcriptional regulator [Cellulomonas sp.]